MPTLRPRHTLTETDELERALTLAAERWPDDAAHRTRLLARVVSDWAEGRERAATAHRALLLATSGSFSGLSNRGELTALEEEWPP